MVSLERVIVLRNGGSGLDMKPGATEISIVQSVFSHNTQDGLTIRDAGDITLTLVTAIKNGQSGLDVTDSVSLTLDKVVSKNNGEDDILNP